MVTSTSLTSDTHPPANQEPIVTASIATSGSSVDGSRASSSSRLSPPVTTSSSRMTSPGSSSVANQSLPTYRQASLSSDAISTSTHPQSPRHSSSRPLNASLPDILHSHLGPSLRPNQHRQNRDRQRPRSHAPTEGATSGHGHHGNRRRSRGDRGNRRARTTSASSTQTQEGSCKEPCIKCVVTITSFRWVLVVLSILGVCCVASGIILAALHAVGNSFLFLAIMFLGLGVLLVVVVGVGWKCTPRGHEPLHALFRIGQFHSRRSRERRHRRHRNRDGNWFGGVLYPEFQYRRPPPSYAASMQNFNNQSLQELRTSGALSSANNESGSLPSSPPPSYRSRTSTLHSGNTTFPAGQTREIPNSRPPTYRSRAPSRRPSLPRDSREETDQVSDQPPADIAFTEPLANEGNNGALSSNDVFIVSSSSSLSTPCAASLSSPSSSSVQVSSFTHAGTSSEAVQPSAQDMQVHGEQESVDFVQESGSSDAIELQESVNASDSSPYQTSYSSPPSASALPEDIPSTSASLTTQQIPSLHQRMGSEDREMLEKALQSLDYRINAEEECGHVNHGANFNEPEHFDTHL